jgi:hypothetical protein
MKSAPPAIIVHSMTCQKDYNAKSEHFVKAVEQCSPTVPSEHTILLKVCAMPLIVFLAFPALTIQLLGKLNAHAVFLVALPTFQGSSTASRVLRWIRVIKIVLSFPAASAKIQTIVIKINVHLAAILQMVPAKKLPQALMQNAATPKIAAVR